MENPEAQPRPSAAEIAKQNELRIFQQHRNEAMSAVRSGADAEGRLIKNALVNAIAEPNRGRAGKADVLSGMSRHYHDAVASVAQADTPAELQKAHASIRGLYKQAHLDEYVLDIPENATPEEKMQLMHDQLQQDLAAFPERAVEEHLMARYFDAKAKSTIENEKVAQVTRDKQIEDVSRSEVRRACFSAERADRRVAQEEHRLLSKVGNGATSQAVEYARHTRTHLEDITVVPIPAEQRQAFYNHVAEQIVNQREPQARDFFNQIPAEKRDALIQKASPMYERMGHLERKLQMVIDTANPSLICGTVGELKHVQSQWNVLMREVDVELGWSEARNSWNNFKQSVQEARMVFAGVIRGEQQPSQMGTKVREVMGSVSTMLDKNAKALTEGVVQPIRAAIDRVDIKGVDERLEELGHRIDQVVIVRIAGVAGNARQRIADLAEGGQGRFRSLGVDASKKRIDVEHGAKRKWSALNREKNKAIKKLRDNFADVIDRPPYNPSVEQTMIPVRNMSDNGNVLAQQLVDYMQPIQIVDVPISEKADDLINKLGFKEPADLVDFIHDEEQALRTKYETSGLAQKSKLAPQDIIDLRAIQINLNMGIKAYEQLLNQNGSRPPSDALRLYKDRAEALLVLVGSVVDSGTINDRQKDVYQNRLEGMNEYHQQIMLERSMREAKNVGELARVMANPQADLIRAVGTYFTQDIPQNEREDAVRQGISSANAFLSAWQSLPPEVEDRLTAPDEADDFLPQIARYSRLRTLAEKVTRGELEKDSALRQLGEIYQD